MKILLVNTSENTGGAAVAANRLKEALNNSGVKVKMMVREKKSDDFSVVVVGSRVGNFLRFCYERFVIWLCNLLSRRNLFAVSIANTGIDITRTRDFREADLIHLHWINHGMLSLEGIRKILDSGKPVVWTMHDMWPATAICHLTMDCCHFTTKCFRCQYLLPRGFGKNLAKRVWQRKQSMFENNSVQFVACSEWMAGEARLSALLKNQSVVSIPNPIDTHFFCKKDRTIARQDLGLPIDGRLIIFAAQRATNKNKGISYLIESLEKLAENHPEMRQNTVIAILGSHSDELAAQLPLPSYPLGYVSDSKHIVNIYNAADVFVLPSLSDNLPNTIMEAMACGVPCVGFDVGGIPEMIDHRRNGYVAKFRDSDDLAAGIHWVL
ncbi:MAG: glycosyltransferase, partial [Prevotella sp.]|nr:glycosyltransferase [Prevotella sp.]